MRVVLPPVPAIAPSEKSGPLIASLTLYLYERLGECEGARVVSNARAAAILAELKGGKRDHSPEKLLQEFCEYMPVDAVVEYEADAAALRLSVNTKQGVLRHEIPLNPRMTVQASVVKAVEALADDLKLPAPQKKLLAETRIKDPAAFEAYYTSQVLWARWPNNPGEARLNVLRAVLEKNRKDPYLAAQILKSADILLENARRRQEFAESAWTLARLAVEPVLGTRFEEAACCMLQRKPDAFEKDLIALSRPLPGELFEEAVLPEGEKGEAAEGFDPIQAPEGMERRGTLDKRLGALRLLGFIQSRDGYERVLAAAKNEDARVRQAAAVALRFYNDEQSVEALKRLARDDNEPVAFAAEYGLWKKDRAGEKLLPLARKAIEREGSAQAVEVVSKLGTRDDLPLLRRLARDVNPSDRRQAVSGILRLAGADDALLCELLRDVDETVVLETFAAFPAGGGAEPLRLAVGLANDPFGPLAEAARLALSPYRPKDKRERILFDLAIEHPYLRMRLVDALASAGGEQSVDELEKACANRHAHTRAHALVRLMERSPDKGRKALAQALRDPYRWVRLHAAARLAEVADATCADAVKAALAAERDKATQLYLSDALAKAEGRPLPAPQPGARSVRGEKSLTWLCGHGLDTERSPFDAYYNLTPNVGEWWKKGYAAGKIFFGRVNNTVGHPGLVILDPAWEDQFWLSMQDELPDENLPYLDGLVFGEETMSVAPETLWQPGWRLFCLDAGIDPSRVKGDMKNLNVYEARAWTHWALERAVDGFNALYDYTKLKYGKLRPGIQVATFLPEQGMLGVGDSPADLRWKFDVGGVYDYKGCNRMAAYSMVRRYKTLWPERPIIWLSLGVGGYEMNPVKRTQEVPSALMIERGNRAWADSVSAYAAGADPGWFSVWIFVAKDWKGTAADLAGVQVLAEDIFPGSAVLERAIDYSFRGAEADYDAVAPPKLDEKKLGDTEEEGETEDELGLEHKDVKKAKIRKAIEEHKEKFRLGFYAYGKYVYDCARALEGLPRQNPRPAALVIRPNVSVWSYPATRNPLIPAEALLISYDFLCDVNQTPGMDLSRYRLIIVHDPGPLADETIESLTRWLREQPGLLYVHRAISADNADEASRPDDHDGVLKNDWPWEQDVSVAPAGQGGKPERCALSGQGGEVAVEQACVVGRFTVTGKSAQALLSQAGKPVLVLWRRDGFKGAVLFDGVESASGEYLLALREQLNKAHDAFGAGMKIEGPVLHQVAQDGNLVAAACTGYYRHLSTPLAYAGVDLMSGEKNPVVGGGRSGAVTAKQYAGRYVASMSGVTVLSEKPITKVEQVDGGLVVQSPGLMRAAAATGAVTIAPLEGAPLPAVERPFEWMLVGETEGAVSLPLGETGSTLTYFRCKRSVRVLSAGQ